jgi:hypothetical protein
MKSVELHTTPIFYVDIFVANVLPNRWRGYQGGSKRLFAVSDLVSLVLFVRDEIRVGSVFWLEIVQTI